MPNTTTYWFFVALYLLTIGLWVLWVPTPRDRAEAWKYGSFMGIQLLSLLLYAIYGP